jgi:hypothetical protein
MANPLVNLDDLIPRDDFETTDAQSLVVTPNPTLSVGELERLKVTYSLLRKPDFQRETADWTVDKVVDLIRSFLDGDLIPALILWRSPTNGNFFVIDGAHRLSALVAWVQDDYGDGAISRDFFSNVMPPEQLTAAERCRAAVKKEIGTYEELTKILHVPGNATPDRLKRAKNLATIPVQLQWVPGDAKQAEDSFFKINQKATPISEVELLMLKSRRKPNAIASRALIRAGVGHKYWSSFNENRQREIETVAREIYDILFVPALEVPIKTLDLPIAGRGYSADSVKLIFDFVNLANKINLKAKKAVVELPADDDGSTTVKFLGNVKRLAQLISGLHPSSLGLHPAVYFYGATARYQPAAFLSVVSFVDDLSQRSKLPKFTAARSRFEGFLVEHAHFLNQIVREFGASGTTMTAMIELFNTLLDGIWECQSDDEIVKTLQSRPKLNVLSEITPEERKLGKNFSAETKSRIFLRDAINSATLCAICAARVHVNSISIDHKTAKRDGGIGDPANGQLSHPYCNSARDVVEPVIASFRARVAEGGRARGERRVREA